MSIYEIDQALLECVDQETGEIINTDRFDELAMERKAKIGNVACWYKNLMAEAKALGDEAEKLTKRKDACEAQAKRLKDYLFVHCAGEKFKDSRCSIYYSKSAPSVRFEDEGTFLTRVLENRPDLVIHPEPKVDKTAVKKAIEAGEDFEGVWLEPTHYVVIK